MNNRLANWLKRSLTQGVQFILVQFLTGCSILVRSQEGEYSAPSLFQRQSDA
jgi:hypothetical protein